MKKRLKSIVCSLLIMAIIVTTGCSRKSEGKKKIVITWAPMTDIRMAEVRKNLAKLYEETHPQIRIRLQGLTGGVYETKLLTQVAGGVARDVVDIV